MNPILMQAMTNLTKQKGETIRFVVGPPPNGNDSGGDPDRVRFFNVFIGHDWKTGELFEFYADVDPDPRCRWATYWTHEAGELDDLMVEGVVPVLVFDPDACSYDKFKEATNYYTTEEGSPERARQEEEYARAFPELKAENLYAWQGPGQFLAQIEAKQGAKST